MGIMSGKVIVARKGFECNDCKDPISKGQQYFRMFGNAEPGDPPYTLKICIECAKGYAKHSRGDGPYIKAVLEENGILIKNGK